jgi:cell wall assembly regulator SMI1
MHPAIERIDVWLRANRPAYHAKLQPGATDEQLSDFGHELQVILPEGFKDFYRWRNGQGTDCYEAFCNNAMFVSMEDAMDTRNMLKGLLEAGEFKQANWWNPGWIPLLDNGGGDHLCVDTEGTFTGKPGQILEFRHDDARRRVLFPSFDAFLTTLADFLTQNEFEDDEEFWIIDPEFIAEWYSDYPKQFQAGPSV